MHDHAEKLGFLKRSSNKAVRSYLMRDNSVRRISGSGDKYHWDDPEDRIRFEEATHLHAFHFGIMISRIISLGRCRRVCCTADTPSSASTLPLPLFRFGEMLNVRLT